MLPTDPIDELVHRAHNEAQGAPPEFMGRLRARMMAERVSRKRARVIYFQAAAAVAAVVILAVVVGFNLDRIVPSRPMATTQPESAKSRPQPENTFKEPAQPEPKPEPQPPANQPQPEPQDPPVEDEPEPQDPPKPTPEPETPKPEPKPDDVVKQPEPQPDEPKTPDGTKAEPKPADAAWCQVSIVGQPKLRVRYGSEDWRDYDGEILKAGVQLSARRETVDFTLADGGIGRFNGDMQVTLAEEAISFTVTHDSLYLDNLGTGKEVRVAVDTHSAVMSDGAGVFYKVANGMEVACLAGAVSLNSQAIEVGTMRRATARGLGDAKPFKSDRFLKDLPRRVLMREDFDKAPEGGMYEEGERLENGMAVADKAPHYIGFRYNQTFTVLPGTVLRFRVRATDVSKLELEQFTTHEIVPLKRNEEQMFKHIWSPGNNEWQVIELRLEDIPLKDNAERKLMPGDLLRNFKLHFEGKKLEIDWVEFVREQK